MRKYKHYTIANRLATLLLAGAAVPSVAQGGNEPAISLELEEILVTGNTLGTGEVRANVQIDSSVITQLAPGTDAAQLLRRVSGIQVGSSDALGGGGFDSTINMRGFGKDNIGFSIDGIPNGRTTLGGGAVPNRFMETSNLEGINVSQSAGVVGSPSRQALVGHIDYLTRDPEKDTSVRIDYSSGSFDYNRYFLRADSGTFGDDWSAYFSVSQTDDEVWIGEGTGGQDRLHVDLKIVKEFENGGHFKFRNSYNDRDGNGYNIVSYLQTPCADEPNRCFFDQFAPSNPAFRIDPTNDGYTDDWTNNALVDRLYRPTRGNEREDNLSYFDVYLPLSENTGLTFKPYYHSQEGVGRFMNHEGEGAVPDALSDLNDGNDNTLYFRNNAYEMDRYGFVAQLQGNQGSLLDWTAGIWYEDYSRTQTRTWHDLHNQAAGPSFLPQATLTSEDKEWDNQVYMVYASNKSTLVDDRLVLEYGFSYMDNEIDYNAPIQNSDDGLFNVSSEFSSDGFAPKFGVLFQLSDSVEVFAGYAKNLASISDGIMEDVGDEAASGDRVEIDVELDEADVYDLGVRYTTATMGAGLQFFHLESEENSAIDLANSLASNSVLLEREVDGVELTLTKSFGAFEVYIAGTVQDHQYNNDGPVPFIRDGEDLVGIPTENLFAELSWKPSEAFKVAINANYTSDRAGFYADPLSSSGLTPTGDFVNAGLVEAGIRSAGDLASVTSSDETIPSYTVVGLDMSYTVNLGGKYVDTLRFNFNVSNLTDKEFLSGVAPELLGVDRKWAGRYFIGAPRTSVFTVSAEF